MTHFISININKNGDKSWKKVGLSKIIQKFGILIKDFFCQINCSRFHLVYHNKLLFILHRKKETLQNDLFLNDMSVKIKDENEDQRSNNSNGTDAENGNFPNRLV